MHFIVFYHFFSFAFKLNTQFWAKYMYNYAECDCRRCVNTPIPVNTAILCRTTNHSPLFILMIWHLLPSMKRKYTKHRSMCSNSFRSFVQSHLLQSMYLTDDFPRYKTSLCNIKSQMADNFCKISPWLYYRFEIINPQFLPGQRTHHW